MAAAVRALTGLVVSLELRDEDAVDPDALTNMLEDIVAQFGSEPEEVRFEITRIINELAAQEPNERRREVLEELPDGLGLIDED